MGRYDGKTVVITGGTSDAMLLTYIDALVPLHIGFDRLKSDFKEVEAWPEAREPECCGLPRAFG